MILLLMFLFDLLTTILYLLNALLMFCDSESKVKVNSILFDDHRFSSCMCVSTVLVQILILYDYYTDYSNISIVLLLDSSCVILLIFISNLSFDIMNC